MPPQFLAWQFWGVISPHLPNKRHMRMLPPRTGRTIPTGSCCRATGIYIHNCVPIRAKRYPLTLRQVDRARGIVGTVRCAGRPGRRQVPFPTLKGIDGRFYHVRAVFGGRCNSRGKFFRELRNLRHL
jgi:hypothetical protein